MANKHNRLALAFIVLMLLLTVALGSVAPGVATRVIGSRIHTVEVLPGLHNQWAGPVGGGGSGVPG